MRVLPISKFKATCSAVLQQVHRSGAAVRITRRGEPIADVAPPRPTRRPASWLGVMAGRTRVLGDVTVASRELAAWEAEEEQGISSAPISGAGACKRLPGWRGRGGGA